MYKECSFFFTKLGALVTNVIIVVALRQVSLANSYSTNCFKFINCPVVDMLAVSLNDKLKKKEEVIKKV
jgi:hypothetical protein